jgi:hypothetical protein
MSSCRLGIRWRIQHKDFSQIFLFPKRMIESAVTGATATYFLFPVVISSVGFSSGGIVAGSYAAGMMSAGAVANGGGIAAGSTVAVLQSAGAAGIFAGPVGWIALASGAGIGAGVSLIVKSFY